MRIHEVEIYTVKQIRAFIYYLNVLADEKDQQENVYLQPVNNAAGSCIGGLTQGLNAGAAPPEYLRKVAAQQAAEKVQE